jgi:TonB-linked SusC/RagA family outer membrane protein
MQLMRCTRWLYSAGMWFVMLAVGVTPLTGQAGGTVSGQVTDRVTERALTGASIVVVGTDLRGSADNDGNFIIRNVPPGTYTLRVVFVGYTPVEQPLTVSLTQEAIANIGMQPTAIQLDEIVLTGTVGGTSKRSLGNAVSTVKVEEFVLEAPINSVTELLTARTPGLTLVANSGQTGSASNVRIRGAGSIYGGYAPIYYIDGIRFESGNMSNSGNGTIQSGTALDFINPKDIESIEVIKGPAAATLYGADAAGGVIQIITKRGQRGQEGVRWTASAEAGQVEWTESIGNPMNYWRCTTSNQGSSSYPGCQVVAGNRDSLLTSWWGTDASGNAVERWDIPAEDVTQILDADGNETGEFVIQDDALRRHPVAIRKGSVQDYNLSASGGGQSFSYYLSLNRNEEEGVFLNNYANRTAGRANFDFNVAETLDMAVQFSFARTQIQQPLNNNASNSVLRNAFRGRARAYRRDWEAGFRGFNPWLSNEYNQQSRIERMTIGFTTNWDPFPWFQNKLTLGLDKQDFRRTVFYEIDTTGQSPWGTINGTGTVNHFLPITQRYTVDYAGTLDFDINPTWSLRSSAGMQLNSRIRRTTSSGGEGLVANNLNLVSSAAVTTGSESFSEQTSLGFFLQEEVAWRDRLYLTGALRVDDNSAFGSDFSMVIYPKASVAWMLSEEDFFNVGWTDQLKLRFAWGKAGNAPGPFEADRTYTTGNTSYDNAVVNTLLPSNYGNPDLKAEEGSEWETGLDASIWNGRAGLEFTYYNQNTKDALVLIPDPGSTGFSGSHLVNIGEIANSGLEILITGTPVYSRSFAWDLGLAIATNKNRLSSFNGSREEIVFGSFADVQRHREGFPLGGFWGYDVLRDANGDPDTVGIPDYTQDSRGITVLSKCQWNADEGGNQSACDDIFIGPSTPTREIGFTNTFTVLGNFRIFAQFDYRGGHYQWCAICSIRSRSDRNTWDINTGGTELNPDVSELDVRALRSLQTISHISSADFIKFRELALTYQIPGSWGGFFRRSRWSITVSGRNLWMWTKYEGTGDPEVQFNSNSSFSRLDYASTPQVRRVSASMRVTF